MSDELLCDSTPECFCLFVWLVCLFIPFFCIFPRVKDGVDVWDKRLLLKLCTPKYRSEALPWSPGACEKFLDDTCSPVICPSLSEKKGAGVCYFSFFLCLGFLGGFYNSFAQNWRKPLRSRLSPAANDVNPVHTVFVNVSL